MLFSSPIFLFGFLPFVLFAYYVSPRQVKNLILLVASLFFYAWGEGFYVLLMVVSIAINFVFGLLIDQDAAWKRRLFLSSGVAVNLVLLGTFKYGNFVTDNINDLLSLVHIKPFLLEPVHLPLGISFFTFQAISYLVDVYRRETPSQRNIVNLALYISLFSQLIAGPIVRYRHISGQIIGRKHSIDMMANGVERFVFGLAKKMLIANPLGEVADGIFSLPGDQLMASLAWLGVICYALQIYFDFSGYSDMAIGLGRLFGFQFLENFNYPYISRSVQEFWQRWHISLSTWFRDYLYIPLGGSRLSPWRVYRNLFTVFLLCGLWHGASWKFVVWGLIHGMFLVAERVGLGKILQRTWSPIRYAYTLMVVLVGWVFFRADDLTSALEYLSAMFGLHDASRSIHTLGMYVTNEVLLVFVIGILLSAPIYGFVSQKIERHAGESLVWHAVPRTALVGLLLFVSVIKLSAGTYNPFIYFRF